MKTGGRLCFLRCFGDKAWPRCMNARGAAVVATRHARVRAVAPTTGVVQVSHTQSSHPIACNTESTAGPTDHTTLAEIVHGVPELTPLQTEQHVWAAESLSEAWNRLHRVYSLAMDKDAQRAVELREKDYVALALCNTRADTLHLMSLLPPKLREALLSHPQFLFAEVEEFFVHLGQSAEVRGGDWMIELDPPSEADLAYMLRRVGNIGEDGRACIRNTAHRVSVWRSREGHALGVTLRVGRYVPNAARALLPLARKGSVLIISKAGMGKTTLLRDLAASLAHDSGKPRVAIIDTSNEVGGDGIYPLPFLGRCRRLQVPRRDEQSRVMVEAVQNHTPEYLIVDEIANSAEAEAAWSIAQRGVHLIATCHGESLLGLLQNQALNMLAGGAVQAFLSNEERRLRNKTKKTILERPYASPFHFVVELSSRDTGYVYTDVNKAVDLLLDEQPAKNDASVGVETWLAQPPSTRLKALVHEKEKRFCQVADDRKGSPADVDCDEEEHRTYDEDGYLVQNKGPPSVKRGGGGNHSNRGVGRWGGTPRSGKKKSEEQLYEELSSLF